MKTGAQLIGVVTLLLHVAGTGRASALANGDFSTGDFSGWTLLTDANGTLGSPEVVAFDTAGTGTPSLSAQFNVGRTGLPVDIAGGGIAQNVNLPGGPVVLSVDIAVQSSSNNADGGLFELLFDGTVVASYDVGAVNLDTIYRDTLTATIDNVTAGTHQFEVHIGREFGSSLGNTPDEYLDYASIVSVPEPASLTLCCLGASAIVVSSCRRRDASV